MLSAVALVVSCAVLSSALATSALARSGPGLVVKAPGTVFVSSSVRVSGRAVRVPQAARAVLMAREQGPWRRVAHASLVRRPAGTFALTFRAPERRGALAIRVQITKGSVVVVSSPARRLQVEPRPLVIPASDVTSVPAPGGAGVVVLHARLPGAHAGSARAASNCPTLPGTPAVGQVTAVGYSPATPYGSLTKINLVSIQPPCKITLQTVPATLEELVGNSGASINYASLRDVTTGAAASAGTSFTRPLGKALTCSGGGSASLAGSLSFGVTPSLHASFSLFGGLSSASFSVTGSASASLSADVQDSAGCELNNFQLIAPFDIATFEGTIGDWPIVVTLRGLVAANASLSASAQTTTGIIAKESVTGGVGYGKPVGNCAGHAIDGFYPIYCGPTSNPFTVTPPTVSATASATATITPTLQALLYGAAGPQVSLTTGLDFSADTTKNPWWTLTAPLDIEGSLVAPILDLSTGDVLHHQSSFAVANAGGPFGGQTNPDIVSLSNPGNQNTTAGWATDLQVKASDSASVPITYSAQGLPSGLAIDTNTGEITGAASSPGQSTVAVTAVDTTGSRQTVTFDWAVSTYPGATPDPGPPWSSSLSSGSPPDSVIATPSANVIVSGCSSVTPSGSVAWNVPGTTPGFGCTAAIGDSEGNTYMLTDDSSGTPIVESLDAAGQVRWTNTTQGLSAWGYGPALGSDGSVFFSVGDGPTTKVLGFDMQNGAPTFDRSFDDVLGVYAYSGGVAVVTLSDPAFEVIYLSYAGAILNSYDTTAAVQNVGGAGWAGGANGTVFLSGYQTCGATDNASVEKITPSGVAWTWTDSGADTCRSSLPAATPDGGVVLSRGGDNTGALEFTSIGPTGTERWDETPAGPFGSALRVTGGPLVDANGVVALPFEYEITCANGTDNSCSEFQVDFVSQEAGQQVFPSEELPDTSYSGSYGSWGDLSNAIGEGSLYVERASSEITVSAYAVSGLAIDYQVALQEQVEAEGSSG
jgi:Putative Ig domain